MVSVVEAIARSFRSTLARDANLTPETRILVQTSLACAAVTGAYFKTGKQLQVVVEVTDTRTYRVLGVAGPVYAETERPDSSLHVIADSVVAILHRRS